MKKNRLIIATSSLMIGLFLVIFLAMTSSVLAKESEATSARQTNKVSIQKDVAAQPNVIGVERNARAGLDIVCSTPGLSIPDNDPNGVTNDIVIGSGGSINDLNVSLDATHTWVGDLIFTVEHVDTGTTATIVDQPGLPVLNATFGCNDNDFDNFILDDESANGPHDDACPNTDSTPAYPSNSDWDPIQPLSAFDGEDLAGTWRINVSDNAGGDTGTLDEWCVIADAAPMNYAVQFTKTVGIGPGCAMSDTLNLPYGGGDVTYCYDVTNIGIYTLTHHTVTDSELGVLLSSFPFTLTPGAGAFFTVSTTITQTTVNTATWAATAGMTVAVDSDVAWVIVDPPDPTIDVDPDSVESTQAPDTTITQSLSISNIGTGDLDWTITESLPFMRPQPAGDGNYVAGHYAPSAGAAPANGQGIKGANSGTPMDFALGSNVYSWNSQNGPYYTVFDLDVPEVLPNIAAFPAGGNFVGGGEYVNGLVYMADTANNFYEVDPVTGAILNTMSLSPAPPGGETISGMAVDPTTGIVYGSSTNVSNSSLMTIDVTTGATSLIGTITNSPGNIAITFDGAGDLWGYDIVNDSFMGIDKNTAAGTIIGSLGFDANFGQGMGYDDDTDQVFLVAFNNGAFQPELRIADTNTGNTTFAGVLGATTPGGLNQLSWAGTELATGGGCTPSDIPWASVSPDSGSTAGGDSDDVSVIFDSAGLSTGVYTGTLCVNSNDDDTPLVTVPITLTVVSPTYAIDIAPDTDVSGLPGSTVTHTMWVTNNSNVAGVVSLSATYVWTPTLSGNNFVLNPGEVAMIYAWVDIPADAAGGEMDVATVTASIGDASDSATATTTAENVYGVWVTEDMTGTGNIGSSVTYHVWVTNTGNTTDTYDVTASGNSWTTTPDSPVTLASGEGAMVMVTVDIPGSAAADDMDSATITATSQGDGSSDSVTLTTIAEGSVIYLPFITNN